MSIKEARTILGKEANDMTDEQVQKLVEDVEILAMIALDLAKHKIINSNAQSGDKLHA